MIAYIAICICDGYFSNPAELTDYTFMVIEIIMVVCGACALQLAVNKLKVCAIG